jgi:hypothetical protein
MRVWTFSKSSDPIFRALLVQLKPQLLNARPKSQVLKQVRPALSPSSSARLLKMVSKSSKKWASTLRTGLNLLLILSGPLELSRSGTSFRKTLQATTNGLLGPRSSMTTSSRRMHALISKSRSKSSISISLTNPPAYSQKILKFCSKFSA